MQFDDELRGVFWDLRQIGDIDDPKFHDSVLHRLAAKILDGQAYEQIAFRLCHLIHGAAMAGGRSRDPQSYLGFFCDRGSGRLGWSAGYFLNRLPEEGDEMRLLATKDRLLISYPDRSEPVYVSYKSMPMLVAFMEFLLNTIHFNQVRAIALRLEHSDVSYREVQDVSNELSRTIYSYLRDHTHSVQSRRDFDVIARFLVAASRINEREDFNADEVDDEKILNFWLQNSTVPDTEFKTYRKCFRAFLRFSEMMQGESLRSSFDQPMILGSDRSTGEWDPADPSSPELNQMRDQTNVAGEWRAGLEEDDEAGSLLERLAESDIKFLKGSEARLLEIVERHADQIAGLGHSYLRDKSFGHVQSRISAALKKQQTDIQDLVFAPPETGFDDVVDAFEKIRAHLDDLVHAAAFVLLERDEDDDNGVATPDFAVMSRGRTALKGLQRKGFDAIRDGNPEAIGEFRQAVPTIIALREKLNPFCEKLESGSPWAGRQEVDVPIFAKKFAQIYGVK